jgi:SAM-dependent methyltransferase
MTNYARMYRFGFTPWERYATAAAARIAALLDREETERSRPLGRALDLGCGRGRYTPELARRGWEAVGIDYVPAAIEAAAARIQGAAGFSYGNLITHLRKLEEAGYVASVKPSGDGPARTAVYLTHAGRAALERYSTALRQLLDQASP